jgi:hypothetical protein
MKAQQNNNAEDDGSEEDLSDVVVEDLLVGIRGVAESGVFLIRSFSWDD